MIELLILYVLLKRDLTMYSVQKRIIENFAPFTKPSFGALKPALRRLEEKECLTSRKMMSDGGKLSVYYEISKSGISELKRLILEDLSDNPLQFLSNARAKLCCADCLNKKVVEDFQFILCQFCFLSFVLYHATLQMQGSFSPHINFCLRGTVGFL